MTTLLEGAAVGKPLALKPAETRTSKPVTWFAAAGAGVLVLMVYLAIRWLGTTPAPVPPGPVDQPTYMRAAMIVLQTLTPIAAVVILWKCLVQPWRRDGRPSLDGMLCVGFLTLIWQDSTANYSAEIYTYNANYLNWGAWNNYIPGWVSPNQGRFAEPLLITGLFYLVFAFAGVALANLIMRRAKARWPQLGTVGLIWVALLSLVLLDLVAEPIFCYFGAWVYAVVPEHFSLFHGHYYQFPLFEPILWGLAWTAMAALRYFRNDRGESVAERGVEQLKLSSGKKTAVRFLAIIGALNVAYLLFCNLPYQFVVHHGSTYPQDIIERPYFTQNQCGPGTQRLCPGGGNPVQERGGVKVTPEGVVIKPDGTVLRAGR